MPPKKSVPDEFAVRVRTGGIEEYMCRICAQVRGEIWQSSRYFIRNHLTSNEHVRNMRDLNEMEETRLRGEADSIQEASETRRLNVNDISFARERTKRPRIDDYELQVNGQANIECLDDFTFSAGQDVLDDIERFLVVRDPARSLPHGIIDKFGLEADEADITTSSVVGILRANDLAGALEEEDPTDILSERPADSDYYPYRNKIEFLLDLLDSLPRLRLSDQQMRLVIFVLKEAGVANVPSLQTLRRVQRGLRENVAVPTERRISVKGNVFYVNQLGAQIAQDFANPLIRPFLQFYPERRNGIISESWHGEKWTSELGPDYLTPMVIGPGNQHFFVHELATTIEGKIVVPTKWIIVDGQLCGESWPVTEKDGTFGINRQTRLLIPVNSLEYSYPKLMSKYSIRSAKFSDEDREFIMQMPNPWRKKANGRPVYCVQLRLWQDDASGNRSKQWNKHWLVCVTHAGIPKRLQAQEYFTRFYSCSPHASVLEQGGAFVQEIKQSRQGLIAYDISFEKECMFFFNIYTQLHDNPMLCECSSHVGLQGNYFCPRCKAGGTKDFKSSDIGFESLFQPHHAEPRNVDETREEVLRQLELGESGEDISKVHTSTGVKDQLVTYWVQEAKDRRDTDIPHLEDQLAEDVVQMSQRNLQPIEKINPFLTLDGFDPHRDGPVEPLHTVLLGVVKYAWGITTTELSTAHKTLDFQARLQSIDVDGMNIDPIRAAYIVQYKGSLIGRQFKAILQVISFTLHGLVKDSIRDLWVAAGHMVSLLWFPEIDDIEKYSEELQNTIANFLDKLAVVDSSKMVSKPKCHILTHIVDDIKRFGPAITLSTETFESFNGVFRLCSVLSNHHAPSRDIANNMADMDRFKHIASGGRWNIDGNWVGPGESVINFFKRNETLQNSLGWVNPKNEETVYSIRKPGKKDRALLRWTDTKGLGSIPVFADTPLDTTTPLFVRCLSCVSESADSAKIGSFVVLTDNQRADSVIGKVHEILEMQTDAATELKKVYIIVEKFTVGGRHARLCMPTLHATQEEMFLLASVNNVKFVLNVQHDCERGGCSRQSLDVETQEGQKTSRTIETIKHNAGGHYIVNMHVLHHSHILRKLFDRESYSIPAIVDRVSLHKIYAAEYRARKANKSRRKDLAKGVDSNNTTRRTDAPLSGVRASTAEGSLGLQSVASTSAMGTSAEIIAHKDVPGVPASHLHTFRI